MIDSASPDPGSGGSTTSTDFKKSRRRKPAEGSAVLVPDRLPPHSLEAEQGVLGCILLDPPHCLGECIEKCKSGGEVFYDLKHQVIYEALVEMNTAGEAIDVITLQQHLKDNKQLDAVGGIAYLMSLADAVPSPANLRFYLDIVLDKHILRRIIRVSSEVVADSYEYEGQVDMLLDNVETKILRLSEERVEGQSMVMKDLVHKAINTIEDYYKREGNITGVGTGFPDFDKMTTGLHEGEMIVIAARPSMGKTSLAMNIAEHAALEQNVPVGVFSLEMSAESLVLRMLCSRARVNLRSIREGFLAERDFPKLTNAASRMGKAPLYIDDTAGLSILQLRAKARRMHSQHGIGLFVIDYLQLLHSTSRRSADNRQQEIAEISSGIKALAKELKVPVIVLAQLNRDVEKRPKATPMLSDLRESGAIEQDADLVGLLYKPSRNESEDRDDAEQDGDDPNDAQRVNLLIAKQRNGPTGDVELVFLKGFTRYESLSKVGPEDVPAAS
ncbi:MAG TPA: replicative DNA helicase [Verrucomicrobiales bacterium]|nr:replicative DNA helicase [Verrucomicrobiales bacterium]